MSEKKVVGRGVAIALGSICIVLIAFIAYFSITGISAQNSYNNLQKQVNDLTNITNLADSRVLVNDQTVSQTAGNYTSWMFNPSGQSIITHSWSINYAGVLKVDVQSSTTNNTYVRVIYSWYNPQFAFAEYSWGVHYNNQIEVGTIGTASFPVFPTYDIEIRVGSTNTSENATETVTITYYY